MAMKNRRVLPERETKMGARLKEAREFLHFSQREFAEKIGIKRERLATYEEGRVPVKWEVALRICHRFQISEHWLATGRIGPVASSVGAPFGSFSRNAMFLPSDPILEKLKPGALFSESYDGILKPEYWKLLGQAAQTWTHLDFSKADDPEQLRIKMEADLTRWFSMIPTSEKLRFCRRIVECGALLFKTLYAGPFETKAKESSAKGISITKIEQAIDKELECEGLVTPQK